MSTSQTVLQGQDTVIQAGLYMSFELGDKKWMLTLSDGRRGPSRYSAKRPRKRWAKNYTV
jgi:transposase